MTNKSDKQNYIEIAQGIQDKRKTFAAIPSNIFKNLDEITENLGDMLQYIEDCKDVRLSDISNLESAFWKLQNMFDVSVNDYLQEQFDKHKITLNDDYSIDVGK